MENNCQELVERRNKLSNGLSTIAAKIEQIDKDLAAARDEIIAAGYNPDNLPEEIETMQKQFDEKKAALEAEVEELEAFVSAGLEALK